MKSLFTLKNNHKILTKGISGSTLKIIALISMTIDHIGVVWLERLMLMRGLLEVNSEAQFISFIEMNQTLYDTYNLFRNIGRLAFPIFCFLIVQGFIHTHDVKKYLLRILIFAFLSEIPFDLAFFDSLFYWDYQNIFFTLFLGILAMTCIQIATNKKNWNILLRIIFAFVSVGGCLISANLFKTDYGMEGVLVIIIMYLLKSWKILSAGLSCIVLSSFFSFFSLVPIYFYNGEKGVNMKWIFYFFYPVHILLLYFFSFFIIP